MPPGAASGGQQGAQRADTSVRLEGALCERAAASWRRLSRVALWLWWTPGVAGGRDPVVRAEMRVSICRMCAGGCAEADAIKIWCGCAVS